MNPHHITRAFAAPMDGVQYQSTTINVIRDKVKAAEHIKKVARFGGVSSGQMRQYFGLDDHSLVIDYGFACTRKNRQLETLYINFKIVEAIDSDNAKITIKIGHVNRDTIYLQISCTILNMAFPYISFLVTQIGSSYTATNSKISRFDIGKSVDCYVMDEISMDRWHCFEGHHPAFWTDPLCSEKRIGADVCADVTEVHTFRQVQGEESE